MTSLWRTAHPSDNPCSVESLYYEGLTLTTLPPATKVTHLVWEIGTKLSQVEPRKGSPVHQSIPVLILADIFAFKNTWFEVLTACIS